jgi:hypothetical protein
MSQNALSKLYSIAKAGTNSVIKLPNKSNNIKQVEIMDPVSTIVRLSLLNYLPDGTKISFSENHIKYHEPWVFQGVVRWINGSGRMDLHNLYYPLKKFRQWSESSFGKDEDLDLLKDKCSNGLLKLRSSYSIIDRSICHSLDLYNQMLLQGVEVITSENENVNQISSTMYKHIKSFWSEMEINIVCNLIREIESTNDEFMITNYIKSVEHILSTKDHKIVELINDTLNGE